MVIGIKGFDMRKRNKETVKAYNKWYYKTKLKHKHPEKWHISKRKWVKCPFCNNNHWYNPLRLYEPEVFAMAYGGRGCIKKLSAFELADVGSIVDGVKANYMRDLKDMAAKFLRLYCSEDELKHLFSELVVPVVVGVPVSAFRYSSMVNTPSINRNITTFNLPSNNQSSLCEMKPIATMKSMLEGVSK